jgi:hypothetical protein
MKHRSLTENRACDARCDAIILKSATLLALGCAYPPCVRHAAYIAPRRQRSARCYASPEPAGRVGEMGYSADPAADTQRIVAQ